MFVTEKRNGLLRRKRATDAVTADAPCGCAELHARSAGRPQMWGGGTALNSNEEMKEGGDEMKDVSTTIVRRLTPL